MGIDLSALTTWTGWGFEVKKPIMIAEGIELFYTLDPEPCLCAPFRVKLGELDTLVGYCRKE